MKILGADLPRAGSSRGTAPRTVVSVDASGRVVDVRRPTSVPELIDDVGRIAGDEPFLLGLDVPVVMPARNVRTRPVETLVRRRLGYRLEPGGRTALQEEREPVSGESLLAALAASGHACLSFPERDRRTSGLAEIHPGLVLKSLLWLGSKMADGGGALDRVELFRAYVSPMYRDRRKRGRSSWMERSVAADLTLRALGNVTPYDLQPAREAFLAAASETDVDRAASLLDASLIAGTVLRYLESPETCVFIGDREVGYTILPADGFIRKLVLRETRPERRRLFPETSLRERLGAVAEVRSLDLLQVRGKPQRVEAAFREPPMYEFDNVDEMLWWKHCRHLAGPQIPTDGLQEMVVGFGREETTDARSLHLVRSRHRTLSFRFDPPSTWRIHLPTRDGRIYPFRIVRAIYETL